MIKILNHEYGYQLVYKDEVIGLTSGSLEDAKKSREHWDINLLEERYKEYFVDPSLDEEVKKLLTIRNKKKRKKNAHLKDLESIC